jgi:tetratricopeptide (TPR) repeat protein
MARYVIFFVALFAVACAAAVPRQKDEAFAFAVEAVQDESFVEGARAAWGFIEAADPDDPRYDRGLRLLARSAEGLDLTWAAGMVYRRIAQARRNMELVPDALKGVERIAKSEGYDEDTLIVSFVAAEEFGDLPGDVQAFVNFQQGLDLARRGADDWAEVRFSKLEQESPYEAQVRYVQAVKLVADGDFPSAGKLLEALKEREALEPRLKRDVERSLARLAFEEERYEDALGHFETLKEIAPDDPEILLEMAWTHFYLGDSRKTLGLLTALDAPVYSTYISPERYLLEALALRRLCQFGAAREAAVRLEQRYKDSFDRLSKGALPNERAPDRKAGGGNIDRFVPE